MKEEIAYEVLEGRHDAFTKIRTTSGDDHILTGVEVHDGVVTGDNQKGHRIVLAVEAVEALVIK